MEKRRRNPQTLTAEQFEVFRNRLDERGNVPPPQPESYMMGEIVRGVYRSLLDETGAPNGVQQKLMRHSNVATTINVYGSATLKAKQKTNSKVVQRVIAQPKPPPEPQAMAV